MATANAQKAPESKVEQPSGGQAMQRAQDRPFTLSRMRDEFDRLFQRFTRNLPHLWETSASTWRWGVDLEEKDEALVVTAEAPGFEPNDFEVHVEEHRLVLRASHKSETEEKGGHKFEERECYQSITLPCEVNKDKVEAAYHNGVLTVTMPKSPKVTGKKVPVKGV